MDHLPELHPLHTLISRLLLTETDAHVFSFPDRQISFKHPVAAALFAARLHEALEGRYEVQLNLPKAGEGKPYISWL